MRWLLPGDQSPCPPRRCLCLFTHLYLMTSPQPACLFIYFSWTFHAPVTCNHPIDPTYYRHNTFTPQSTLPKPKKLPGKMQPHYFWHVHIIFPFDSLHISITSSGMKWTVRKSSYLAGFCFDNWPLVNGEVFFSSLVLTGSHHLIIQLWNRPNPFCDTVVELSLTENHNLRQLSQISALYPPLEA